MDAGLLFGAYHFGDGSDGASQARHFLDVVQPDENTVVVLDFESNPAGPSMTLEEARAFVTHLKFELGRWPGFYSGHDIKEALGKSVDPIAGSGLHNTARRLSFLHAGPNGRCGNTPMEASGLSPTLSTEAVHATATFLMERGNS